MRAIFRIMMSLMGGLLLSAMAAAQVSPTVAQPDVPHLETPHGGDLARDLPIGSYTLATFWVPQHCKRAIRGIAAVDCGRPEVRANGLALHGLWPDGQGKEWPQWCKPAALLSLATIAAHIDVTPSAQQLQHEWAKHGVCMAGYTPERYFDRAEQLYRKVHVPDLRALSYHAQTVESVKRAIADANPGLGSGMFKLTLDKQGWLEEVWFCLDTKFVQQTCPEAQREPADAKVLIWRGGKAPARREAGQGNDGDHTYRGRDRYG